MDENNHVYRMHVSGSSEQNCVVLSSSVVEIEIKMYQLSLFVDGISL